MTKLTSAVLATLAVSSAAFAPQQAAVSKTTALNAKGFEEVGGVPFDPLSLAKLGTGESFDTFPNMFPNEQYLKESEIKHGRQAMLAWTGVWATHKVRFTFLRNIQHAFSSLHNHVPTDEQFLTKCKLLDIEFALRTLGYHYDPVTVTGWIGTWLALPWIPRGAGLDQGFGHFCHGTTCILRNHPSLDRYR